MAQCNRAAQWIDFGRVEIEFPHHRQTLCGKCLVQLKPVHVCQLQSGEFQRLRNRGNRADAHDMGGYARDSVADKTRQWLQV